MNLNSRTLFLALIIGLTKCIYSYAGETLLPSPGIEMKFVENKGQWDNSIFFQSEIPVGTLVFRKGAFDYWLHDSKKLGELEQKRHEHQHKEPITDSIKQHVFSVSFINPSEQILPRGRFTYPEKYNFLLGNDRSKWGQNVLAYKELAYEHVYDGIDMRLYKSDQRLKYEFIVSAGSNPKDIKLKFDGVDKIELIDGRLRITTSVQTINEERPFAYQYIDGKKVVVQCNFKLIDNELSYDLPKGYNKKYDLVIDPQLIFSTSSGSLADNWGNTACVDLRGNLYTGGTVFRTDLVNIGFQYPQGFPTHIGAFQTSFQGGTTDIGILKFDSSGKQMIYGTYIGGLDAEIPTSMITNENQELFILGMTGSTNFPITSGAYDNTFNGGTFSTPVGGYSFSNGTDLVIVKLSNDGSDILASTYVGGFANDGIILDGNPLLRNYGDQLRGDINVDEDDNVYVASVTSSQNFPIVNGFQSTYGGGTTDGVVLKIDSTFSSLVWSTFLGGSTSDGCLSIQRDSLNNVFVCGGTTSNNFPIDTSAWLTTRQGSVDGYVAHISSDGDSLISSSYLGTSSYDQAYFIQLDSKENVYVMGQTTGVYPLLPDSSVYHNNYAGLFIHKLNYELDSTIFSTVIGSPGLSFSIIPNISPTAFLVNDCDNMFLAGWGGETNEGYNGGYTRNMPITTNALINESQTDGSDFYLGVISKDAKSLIYGTYFGGRFSAEHVDGGTSRFDKLGIVYQSVCAGCGGNVDFPTFPDDNNQSTFPKKNASRNCNNGVFKYDLASLEAKIEKEKGCVGLTTVFTNKTIGGADYTWIFRDGSDTIYTTELKDIVHTFPKTGTYRVTLIATDLATCIGVDSAWVTITVVENPTPVVYTDTICVNESKELKINIDKGVVSYVWAPSKGLSNTNIPNPIFKHDTSMQYTITLTDTLGCVRVDTFNVIVPYFKPSFKDSLIGNCAGKPSKAVFLNTSIDANRYLWQFGDGKQSTDKNPIHQYEKFDTVFVTLYAYVEECVYSITKPIVLERVALPNVITPNGDGKNETFKLEGISSTTNWSLDIYNRWGDRVYRQNNYKNDWSGGVLADGTYYYLLTAPDESTCKGWIQLIR